MFVIFDCHNMQDSVGAFRGPWSSGDIFCAIHSRVRFREDVAHQTQGVEVQVIHTGDICQASFSALLVALTSSFALLAVSDTITSFVMTNLHPRKHVFEQFVRTDIAASTLGLQSFRGRGSVWPEQSNEDNEVADNAPRPGLLPPLESQSSPRAPGHADPPDDGNANAISA
jgi:hypothetical protein